MSSIFDANPAINVASYIAKASYTGKVFMTSSNN